MSVQLSHFSVEGLFGRYNNSIRINTDDRITAVIGPNGRGKTICLRMINALYKKNYWYFAGVEFEQAEFGFTNGLVLKIRKNIGSKEAESHEAEEREIIPLSFSLYKGGVKSKEWQPQRLITVHRANMISRYLPPFITRTGPNRWRDDRTGERLTTDAIVERFVSLLPTDIFQELNVNGPEEFLDIFVGVDCHLIETQRLLNIASDEARIVRYEGKSAEPTLVVQQKAQKLRVLLSRQLADYANLSQRLDRSFPRRVIEGKRSKRGNFDEVADRLNELEKRRVALQKAGLLDTEFEPLGIPQDFDGAVAQLLNIYIKDTEEKLDVFSDLLAKITVFSDIVNEKFIDKQVVIDRSEGFKIVTVDTEDPIPLDKLSSGEQHQLIMVFELLFEMKPNSMILIDEPELSLHVAWQKKFINDLKKIIELNGVDVVMATHSPQLIGRWGKLAVELASVEE